ncbi:MAG: crotonase/enoyl-CoA hydratase family protein [Pseudomonadota bacterium]
MSYSTFDLSIEDRIAHLRLNRPDKANAMNRAFWREFPEAINQISDQASARVIVLSAEGKHFTSGMDISVFMEGGLVVGGDNPQVNAEAFRRHIHELQGTFSALENARQPVLAAIQGAAIGAGVDLATACDCRYASADAYFSVRETAIGMTADVGTFPRLMKVIPEGWARQMAYTGERVDAARAKEIGFVNEVYEDADTLLDGVMEIARQIAGHSPLAVAGAKRMANYARDHSTTDALDYIATWNAAMLRPQDIQESFIAKSEGRAPQFADLKPAASSD